MGRSIILLVAGRSEKQRCIRRILERYGLDVLAAPTGVQGLALFRRYRSEIRMAVVDIVIPGVGGLDLAAELERESPETKILYISACASSIAAASIRQRSPNLILLKPFTGKQLVRRIREMLSNTPLTASGRGKRGILIVDRDLGLVFSAGQVLADAGYSVLPAQNTVDARLLIDRVRPDIGVLIMNPFLPGVRSLITTLRKKEQGLSVVALADASGRICRIANVEAVTSCTVGVGGAASGSWLRTIERLAAG